MPLVPTRLGEVAYEVFGVGVPVVLLHATLHDRHDYDSIIPSLAQRFQAVAIDWPWHGESKGLHTTENLNVVMLAGVLEDVVRALRLSPAIFVGNSVGGFAAARLAITQPSRVRGLILVNSGGFQSLGFLRRALCRIVGTAFVARLVFPLAVPAYMAAQNAHDRAITARAQEKAKTSVGAAVAAAFWRTFPEPGYNLRSCADKIRAPTLIVWGSKDLVFQVNDAEAVQSCIGGSTLKVFETGHVVFASRPDAFLEVALPFLEMAAGVGDLSG